jgi:histone H3/H4
MYFRKKNSSSEVPSKGSRKSRDILVVGSKVKDLISDKGLRSSGDLIEALSKHIETKLLRAIERAKANGRQTIRPEDL